MNMDMNHPCRALVSAASLVAALLGGGALLLWIGIQLLGDHHEGEGEVKGIEHGRAQV